MLYQTRPRRKEKFWAGRVRHSVRAGAYFGTKAAGKGLPALRVGGMFFSMLLHFRFLAAIFSRRKSSASLIKRHNGTDKPCAMLSATFSDGFL